MSSKEFSVVVPARLDSSRLAQKLLLSETGQPLLKHTLENLQALRQKADLWLVTDSELLANCADGLVEGVHLSSREFQSGTERIVEMLPKVSTDWVLNVQGDEPEVNVVELESFMEKVLSSDTTMATIAAPFLQEANFRNPNAVKVIVSQSGKALYFSRQILPYQGTFDTARLYHHLGVYAYQKQLLLRWAELPRGPFEQIEKLEQLRALENDISILVFEVSCSPKGIDTQDDYQAFAKRMMRERHVTSK